jgi:hypothetical protein
VAAPPTPAARVPVTIVPAATMTVVVRWMAVPVMRVTMARMPVPMAMARMSMPMPMTMTRSMAVPMASV